MKPDAHYYTIPKEKTGTENDQTINVDDIRLWQVIDIKPDGNFEAISYYLTDNISFHGALGYKNYIGVLEDVASQIH